MDVPFHDPAALESYCQPFLRGEKLPSTATELMASRYVAYATGAIDYLLETHDPKTRGNTDRKSTEEWSRRSTWKSLEILSAKDGGPDDQRGEVEFVARYALDGVDHVHHEHSEFRRIDGRWYFVSGEKVSAAPIKRVGDKVGRNDPCPCGSGKKHKKCCAA
ncbi:MAG: motif domain protein [Myxococcaceae bacterium]|nr:motif domain protein [Myxococcaceae bacterium]